MSLYAPFPMGERVAYVHCGFGPPSEDVCCTAVTSVGSPDTGRHGDP